MHLLGAAHQPNQSLAPGQALARGRFISTRLIGISVFTACVCAAQIRYEFVSLTGNDIHRFATAITMNQRGVAIGSLDSISRAVVLDRRVGPVYPAFAGMLSGINLSGDVIGRTQDSHSFVSEPPYTTCINLSNVGSVDAINDRGDMVGTPFSNSQWFPGLDIRGTIAINNAGQVLAYAAVSAPSLSYFLFTPGKQDVPVPRFPIALNNNGDVLFAPESGEAQGPQYMLTASGLIPLPSGYFWRGFNDLDEAVGFSAVTSPLNVTTITPVLYSLAAGLVDLSKLFENNHALVEVRPVRINNSGEILVEFRWTPFPGQPVAPSAGIGLLVPLSVNDSSARPSTPAGVDRARAYTINGIRIAVSRPAR